MCVIDAPNNKMQIIFFIKLTSYRRNFIIKWKLNQPATPPALEQCGSNTLQRICETPIIDPLLKRVPHIQPFSDYRHRCRLRDGRSIG